MAEFIGTFALCFFGVGSIVATAGAGGSDLVVVALAHVLVLTVFVTATMYISAAQFNPAVSIAFALIGRQSWVRAGGYSLVQLVAAAAGVWAVVWGFGEEAAGLARHGATLGTLSAAESSGRLLVFEALQAAALMFIILAGVADGRAHRLGGVCVGVVVGACILAFGGLTGASMNPARSLASAVHGHWAVHWVYWAGPILGTCAAAVVYRVVFEEDAAGEEPAVPPLHEGDEVHRG